jgi:hypothetical protein
MTAQAVADSRRPSHGVTPQAVADSNRPKPRTGSG